MDVLVLADQQELIYTSAMQTQVKVNMACWERCIRTDGERERERKGDGDRDRESHGNPCCQYDLMMMMTIFLQGEIWHYVIHEG